MIAPGTFPLGLGSQWTKPMPSTRRQHQMVFELTLLLAKGTIASIRRRTDQLEEMSGGLTIHIYYISHGCR